MNKICLCGCGLKLRKDNKTGYHVGHKPCPVCTKLIKRSGNNCCSKSCSAKLHWINNPEMKENRAWNSKRNESRNKNKNKWIENISKARIGIDPWNKGKKGLQVAWNKGLSKERQPFFNKVHSDEYHEKKNKTVYNKYGIKNVGILAKSSPRSKKEILIEKYLPNYKTNIIINSKYKPDYVNEEKKHIIEVYGDYWHCNPSIYKSDFYNTKLKMTAKEKIEKDSIRKNELESLGYTVTIIWESDIGEFIESFS